MRTAVSAMIRARSMATPGRQPSRNAPGTGAIRAMGEHKGSGLALICELLAGALTASGCCRAGGKANRQWHAVFLYRSGRARPRRGHDCGSNALSRLGQGVAASRRQAAKCCFRASRSGESARRDCGRVFPSQMTAGQAFAIPPARQPSGRKITGFELRKSAG